MPDKSMREQANQRYLDSHGITADMVSAHEYERDPPPYEGPSIRGASFLPEAPSPAPITGTGVVMDPDVVMGDFLDDRIDELEKKLNECNEKLKLYEGDGDFDDDEQFQDVREEEPEIPEEIKKPSQPMKKFDYKTMGWVIFKSPADMASSNSIAFRKKVKTPPKNESMLKLPLKHLGDNVNSIKRNESVIKQGGLAWCPDQRWCGNYSTDISFTPDEFIKQVIYKPTEEELRSEWRCEIWVAPGASLKLIKEKIDEGYTIEFEDENDKREVEAMQGGGYRRKNTRRKSRKRNTRRKSRKRNTRRKSRKRSSRRRSKKK